MALLGQGAVVLRDGAREHRECVADGRPRRSWGGNDPRTIEDAPRERDARPVERVRARARSAPRNRSALKVRGHARLALPVLLPALLAWLLLVAMPVSASWISPATHVGTAASPGPALNAPPPVITPTEKPHPTPKPKPTPTPVPTPTPTPTPTPRPTPTPTPTPRPTPTPTPTPRPTPTPTPTPAPTATPASPATSPSPAPTAVVPAGPGSASPRPSAAAPAPTTRPGPSDDPGGLAAPGGLGGGTPGADGDGPGASRDDPAAAGPFGDDDRTRLIVFTSALSTGITLAAAFLLFGRRRRTGDPDDSELAIAAATAFGGPLAVASTAAWPTAVDPGTGGTDIDLPRWRRPSLLAARKSDPTRGAGAGPTGHLAFASPAAAAGMERRLVRYRIVRLLDRPDELMGSTVGSLDEGDQVAVVEQSGLYRRVETPDGRIGWLHKMTLGDLVAAPAGQDAEIDPDVLMAYLAARGRG